MRLSIVGEEYEVRIQKRTVTYVDIMQSGKFLARGEAVLNPLDASQESDIEGVKLAAQRALRALVPIKTSLASPLLRMFTVDKILKKFNAARIRPAVQALRNAERAMNLRIGELRAARRLRKNLLAAGPSRVTPKG